MRAFPRSAFAVAGAIAAASLSSSKWYPQVKSSHGVVSHCSAPESKRQPKQYQECIGALRKLYDSNFEARDRFSTLKYDRESHSADYSFHTPALPDAVAFPASTEEVAKTVNVCAAYCVPVIAFGAGTSLEGHVLPTLGGVTLDMTANMNEIVSFDPDNLTVTVQPGLSYNDLNEFLAPHGLFFAPDPGAGASIGGMIATSCGGTNALKYGTVKQSVVALEVVLADGTVVQTRPSATRKSSAGYHLTELFVGSEGTLGIITKATLQLQPIPTSSGVALLHFQSVADAAACAADLVRTGVDVSRAELMDELMVDAVMRGMSAAEREAIELASDRAVLMVEITGRRENDVADKCEMVLTMGRAHNGDRFKVCFGDDESSLARKSELWRVRKEAYWSAYSLREGASIWTTDVCVPLDKLAACVEETREDLAESCVIAPIIAHAGDGNFHLLMLVDPEDAADLDKAAAVNDRLISRALRMGGTCTGEHGVGCGKREYLVKEHSSEALALMRAVKQMLDPQNILNPGKIFFDNEPKTSNSTDSRSFALTASSIERPCAPDLTHTAPPTAL